jgi:hypothetical protein
MDLSRLYPVSAFCIGAREKDANQVIRDNVANVPAADGGANLNLYTFPYKVWSKQTNDATSCINRCAEYGFAAAGLEYGVECCT